jgi:hypothetical protein
MLIDVNVNFKGVVSVDVPNHLRDYDAKLLAKKFALARILATCNNPDSPDEDAFEEYSDSCTEYAELTAEEDWDTTVIPQVCGHWKVA